MYGAGDVRVEEVPDAQLIEPTDAVDAAYDEKYGRRYPTIVPSIVAPRARAATLRLVPR